MSDNFGLLPRINNNSSATAISTYNISSISAHATAPVVTTSAPHNFVTGDPITLVGNDAILEMDAIGGYGSAGAAKNITGTYTVTVTGASTFTISGKTTGFGAAGTATGTASKIQTNLSFDTDYINALSYGMIADNGTTDNAPIFQALIDDTATGILNPEAKGRPIYLPAGIYYFGSGVQYCYQNTDIYQTLNIVGVGRYDYQTTPGNEFGTVIKIDSNTNLLAIPNHGRSTHYGTITAGTVYNCLFYIGPPQNDVTLCHTGSTIQGINFKGQELSTTTKETLLRINGTNRWRVEDCGFQDTWRALWVDDHVGGQDADWGLIKHCIFNDVNTSVYSQAGGYINGGGLFTGAGAENPVLSSTGVNFTAWSGATEKADFSWTTANTMYEEGDCVTFSGTGDADVDGHFFLIEYTSSTTGSIYLRKDITAINTGTITFCNAAVKLDTANFKIIGARVNGGAGTAGFISKIGGNQFFGNGVEGPDVSMIVDGLGSANTANNGTAFGNLFQSGNVGIALGFFTGGENHGGNTFEGTTIDVEDRGSQSLDGKRLNPSFDANYGVSGFMGFPEPVVGATKQATNYSGIYGLREGTASKKWGLRFVGPAGNIEKVLATESDTTGTATLASGTATVNFTVDHTDANYKISLTGDANETFYFSAKATTGFTITSSNASSTANVDWILTRYV